MLAASKYTVNKECRIVCELRQRMNAANMVMKESNMPVVWQEISRYNDALTRLERCAKEEIWRDKVVGESTRKEARQRLKEYGETSTSFLTYWSVTKKRWKCRDILVTTWIREQQARNRLAHNGNMRERIRLTLMDAHKRGHYMVMNTLTVAPEHEDKVFAKGSMLYREYIRSVHRAVGKARGMNKRESDKDRDMHRYCAVVERGSKTGRLHIHVLHTMKNLPPGSSDPNPHIPGWQPRRRMIEAMRKYWKWGMTAPKALRYGWDDAFSRNGWRWPLETDKRTGLTRPLKHGTIGQIVGYISKYIQKSERTGDRWRTRMSRNYGVEIIQAAMMRMPLKTLARALQVKTLKTPAGMPNWPLIRSVSEKLLLKRGYSMRSFPHTPQAKPISQPGALIERLSQQIEWEFRSSGFIDRTRRCITAIFSELAKTITQERNYTHHGRI